jgi:CRP-like cAMP-binding protein
MAYVSADGYIFKQGDSGGCFFVIESGELVVEIDQK